MHFVKILYAVLKDKKNLTKGTRVVRGPDWEYDDEDGNGEGITTEDRIGEGGPNNDMWQ